jgi:hypothetical protein
MLDFHMPNRDEVDGALQQGVFPANQFEFLISAAVRHWKTVIRVCILISQFVMTA